MGSPVPTISEVKGQWYCADESAAEGGMAVEKWCMDMCGQRQSSFVI